ncbi:bilirubin utilization transcriptional regulator BilQ [Beduinella massiliensis]|uniref:bilirubin utilization transcriptional regulator BilQ n=1 Tax=Beduinella massiliensis TaxID=1852363 RepID=UPI0031F73D0D
MQQTFSYYITVLKKDFDRFCEERLAQIGLTRGLLFFFIYIGKHPGCSPSELCAVLHADSGHTARSVDKLVQSGFVSRTRSETDGRAFSLSLTARGEEAFDSVRRLFAEWDEIVLKDTPDEERKDALRFLSALVEVKEGTHCVR